MSLFHVGIHKWKFLEEFQYEFDWSKSINHLT
jgi:hypothetical protein